jgi:hypothetical protein
MFCSFMSCDLMCVVYVFLKVTFNELTLSNSLLHMSIEKFQDFNKKNMIEVTDMESENLYQQYCMHNCIYISHG